VRIVIDHERCVGAALCVLTAPEIFTQDDVGLSKIISGHERDQDARVQEAEWTCPSRAIQIIQGEGEA
jgi:ferredoxin